MLNSISKIWRRSLSFPLTYSKLPILQETGTWGNCAAQINWIPSYTNNEFECVLTNEIMVLGLSENVKHKIALQENENI